MPSLLRHVSRMRSLPLLALFVLTMGLTGCYTKLGTVASTSSSSSGAARTVPVTEAAPSSGTTDRTPSASADASDAADAAFRDVDHYALDLLSPSDRMLVKRATRLLEARAEGDISHAAYQDRVRSFQLEHPGFYGNFFGDPLYATYDLRYTRLAELRRRISVLVNPWNSIWNASGVYCAPFSYDPNFGGVCRGVAFAQSDFFLSPFSFRHAGRSPFFYAGAPSSGETGSQLPRAAASILAERPARLPNHVNETMQAELTDEFHRFLSRRTADMERQGRVDLIRRLASYERSGDRLSSAERADLIAKLRDDHARSPYRARHRHSESTVGADHSDRRDRDTRSRRTSQADRGSSDQSGRSRARSRSGESSSSGSNSERNRSRGGGS